MSHEAGIGNSSAFRAVIDEARALAPVPRSVLIRGERGTGKELLARFIHRASRRTGPYLVVNCGAFQEELLVSQLFGHEKGAFTGATERRIGLFERAHGGSLFLDEIATLSRQAQARLLRVLEYQSFERIGGAAEVTVDVRIIAATNADLEGLMERGEFLRDLHDRLSFAVLRLPPLRERRDDVPELVRHFVARLHEEMPDLGRAEFTEAALDVLMSYRWPGNVRELRNVIERLYVFDRDRIIDAPELPLELSSGDSAHGTFSDRVRAFEKALLHAALRDAAGNQREAARQLGMSYDQFRHYYRKYKLADPA